VGRTVGGTAPFRPLDWPTPAWPRPSGEKLTSPPPAGETPMPHGLHFRTNCLACHAAPGAVVELRTTHPAEEDCLSCHVPAEGTTDGTGPGVFTRPLDGAPTGGGR